MTKYSPVTAHLASLPEDQRAVEMTMIEIGRLCGGLPPSASSRTWWANNSQVQARAWRTAGWHVERVDLNGGRVRFERGRVGGSGSASSPATPTPRRPMGVAPVGAVVHDVSVEVVMSWRSRGSVTLHAAGLTFPILGTLPGAYRLQCVGRGRTRVYIGEAVNLQRRMGNYRRPGPRQQTSIRINELLNAHLDAGGTVELATCTEAAIVNAGVERAADLSLKRERVLVEHAALLVESGAEEIDVENR